MCTTFPSAPQGPGTLACRRRCWFDPRSPCTPCRGQSQQFSGSLLHPAAGCPASDLCQQWNNTLLLEEAGLLYCILLIIDFFMRMKHSSNHVPNICTTRTRTHAHTHIPPQHRLNTKTTRFNTHTYKPQHSTYAEQMLRQLTLTQHTHTHRKKVNKLQQGLLSLQCHGNKTLTMGIPLLKPFCLIFTILG